MTLPAFRKRLVRTAAATSLAMLGALVLAFAGPMLSDGGANSVSGPDIGSVGVAIALPVLIASSGLRP